MQVEIYCFRVDIIKHFYLNVKDLWKSYNSYIWFVTYDFYLWQDYMKGSKSALSLLWIKFNVLLSSCSKKVSLFQFSDLSSVMLRKWNIFFHLFPQVETYKTAVTYDTHMSCKMVKCNWMYLQKWIKLDFCRTIILESHTILCLQDYYQQ